ncbi:AbrB/MazE/SpoVT family DNA-binding domain-containing protein [Candidatus Woesearchaeota archaeon]|nr:AbrB/MazE/SpoVT family DNA-binding domain-containing protein [Candidatus Woesearchaeota archaeon]
MKCHTCNKPMNYTKGLEFNEQKIDGWKCASCGEIYFNPEQVHKALLMNKLKKEAIRAKLGKVRSNLILRLPRDVEEALNLHQGEEVLLRVENNQLKVTST